MTFDRDVERYGDDIFTEPDAHPDGLANLGPLAPMAGTWTTSKDSDGSGHGEDVHPEAHGAELEKYVEHHQLVPTDPQTNGPQLLYGLRYHTHINEPDKVETFHDQVGYWLWEPATGNITLTLAIPRAQVAMAGGNAAPDATEITLKAEKGDPNFGILSGPFLERAFETVSWEITVTIHNDGSWTYFQDTVLIVEGSGEFHHTDTAHLFRTEPPQKNPLAQ